MLLYIHTYIYVYFSEQHCWACGSSLWCSASSSTGSASWWCGPSSPSSPALSSSRLRVNHSLAPHQGNNPLWQGGSFNYNVQHLQAGERLLMIICTTGLLWHRLFHCLLCQTVSLSFVLISRWVFQWWLSYKIDDSQHFRLVIVVPIYVNILTGLKNWKLCLL